MEYQGQSEEGHHQRNMMFCCGTAEHRDQEQPVPEAVITDACGTSSTHKMTYDAAMFPFLFPGGLGAFRNGESLSGMLQQRVQQLFSPFTLMKEYVLVMYQVSTLHLAAWLQPCCMQGCCATGC